VLSCAKGGDVRVHVLRGKFCRAGDDCKRPITLDLTTCQSANQAKTTKVSAESTVIDCGEPAEVMHPNSLSYKETISQEPLAPRWFCSHWWGEAILSFQNCCDEHAKLRRLSDDEATYWVCAYANRQHSLEDDICIDPDESSFRRAMALAEGVLLILDKRATPFSRMWCDFELYKTVSDTNKLLDVVTEVEGTARILSEGPTPGEAGWEKKQRELLFPISLLTDGLRTCLEKGQASREADKIHIMNCMTGNKKNLNDRGVLNRAQSDRVDQAAYNAANMALHGIFAVAAWPQAVRKNLVKDFDRLSPGSLSLPRILIKDIQRKTLSLDFQNFEEMRDAQLVELADGLPPNLREVEVNLSVTGVANRGVKHFMQALPRDVEVLNLRFAKCSAVSDPVVRTIGLHLSTGLVRLTLDFRECKDITDAAVKFLASRLPGGLIEVSMDFRHCAELTDDSLTALGEALTADLTKVELNFTGCKLMTSLGVQAFARAFPASPSAIVVLSFRGSGVGRDFESSQQLEQWSREIDLKHA